MGCGYAAGGRGEFKWERPKKLFEGAEGTKSENHFVVCIQFVYVFFSATGLLSFDESALSCSVISEVKFFDS